jgi:hypothetical protein
MDAVTPENCQTEPVAMPTQSVIGNAIASKVRLLSDGHVIGNRSVFVSAATFWSPGTRGASSDTLVGPAENHDPVELSVELIGAFRLLADLTEYGHRHVTRGRHEEIGCAA